MNRRFATLMLFFSLFVLLVIAQYFKLMVLQDGPQESTQSRPVSVERGPILDRNGRILAVQTRLYSVTAWIPHIEDKDQTAERLAAVLNQSSRELRRKFDAYSGFLYVERKISPSASDKVQNMIDSGLLPGISLEPEYGRNYPEQDLAAHVLGYVGTDNIGLDGIELTYDGILSPNTDSEELVGSTRYGNQLFLTIDLNIQFMAESIAERALEEHDANAIMILVMDAKNGDILAMTSTPDFNPNTFQQASRRSRQNLPITYSYEPGSVFKIFSIASLMEMGAINAESEFFCDGHYERTFPSNETVRINCLGRHGLVTPQQILQYSCNSGAAYASDLVDKEGFYRQIRDFGFGGKTNLPFPGETRGLLEEPENWSGRTKPTIAIGQEISVSAVQMAAAATAFSNQGIVLQPHIVKKVVAPNGQVLQESSREPLRRVIRPEVARAILLMMETVTGPGGTAQRAKINGVRVSAKTGTAQKFDPQTGTYSNDAFVASCMSLFPTEDPQLITYVVIDTPKGDEYYGGRIAAPLMAELGEQLVDYLGIPTSQDTVVQHPGIIKLKDLPPISIGEELPDLRGIAKRRLLPLLQQDNIEVHFRGEGWVSSQSPAPGTPVTDGMKLELEFE